MPINLVFQGGGVRGIAYAGALELLPPKMRIEGVAGTSAGSIVAALLAIGKTPAEINAILKAKQISSLLQSDDVARFDRLKAFFNVIKPMLDDALAGKNPSVFKLMGLRETFKKAASDIDAVWKARGIHRSQELGEWLRSTFGEKKFADAGAVKELKIIASDVSRQKYKIYSKEHDGSVFLANAVHASISIPLFFDPYVQGTDLYVDGGVLSNYPAFVFAESRYPTIGFRLRDLLPAPGITDTVSYLKALLQTMTEAHDKERILPRHYFPFDIITPPSIPFDKFTLTDTDIAELLNEGRQVGRQVDWAACEKKERRVAFFDPHADETLDFSVAQARLLYAAYTDQAMWVDELTQKAEFMVRIAEDWSTTYDRYATYTVAGDKPLILQRFRVGALGRSNKAFSIMDLDCIAEEVLASGRRAELIRIPAWNTDQQKGYILFYSPPVTAIGGPRTFHTGFCIPKEFESVTTGEQGPISYGIQPLAHKHRLQLTIRILAHTSLPRLVFSSDFGKTPSTPPVPTTVDSVVYNEYSLSMPEMTLSGEIVFNLQLRVPR